MAINLSLLTAAAPYIIDAANAILAMINKNKKDKVLNERLLGQDEQLDQLVTSQAVLMDINEQQSKVIKDLAEQNQSLIISVRNTRMLALAGIITALLALLLSFLN